MENEELLKERLLEDVTERMNSLLEIDDESEINGTIDGITYHILISSDSESSDKGNGIRTTSYIEISSNNRVKRITIGTFFGDEYVYDLSGLEDQITDTIIELQ